MDIGFIGGGKVGKSFGKYLINNGYRVVGYYSRSLKSAKESANFTNSLEFESLEAIVEASDAIFITTPDDTIEEVANSLSETGKLKKGQLLIHMSGAHSSRLLTKAKDEGCYIASLHPLQAFANIEKAVLDLKETVFSIEGDDEAKEILLELIQDCGNKFFTLKGEDKALYHGAACVVSNYLVTLMDLGISLLTAAGIDADVGFDALYPLITGSMNNIKNLGTIKALTGPIVRGDVHTIKSHIDKLEEKLPNKLEFYKFLGRETTSLAKKGRLKDEVAIEDLNKLWKEEIV
ncbi:Rossmann-like and DUF2520 domain-containing protein [Alkaliphilus serpentinus]|uniref:Rossmann-like and DUF2520 domain-containing protein n=1 Tax=Alkaliphilus serpentinus TaxID=1482731 RepID=UPI0018657A64|nr:Rossmann-like and DUF2520 domain-containing protein [Alkaliphilus serpentinus]